MGLCELRLRSRSCGGAMTFTITVHNDLAQRLESAAIEKNVSVEELATSILDRAVARPDGHWIEKNQRRLCLIRKSVRQSICAEEQQELDELQSEFDLQFKEFDESLDFMRSSVEESP